MWRFESEAPVERSHPVAGWPTWKQWRAGGTYVTASLLRGATVYPTRPSLPGQAPANHVHGIPAVSVELLKAHVRGSIGSPQCQRTVDRAEYRRLLPSDDERPHRQHDHVIQATSLEQRQADKYSHIERHCNHHERRQHCPEVEDDSPDTGGAPPSNPCHELPLLPCVSTPLVVYRSFCRSSSGPRACFPTQTVYHSWDVCQRNLRIEEAARSSIVRKRDRRLGRDELLSGVHNQFGQAIPFAFPLLGARSLMPFSFCGDG